MNLTRIMRWVEVYVLLYLFLWFMQFETCTAWYVAHAVPIGAYDPMGGPDMSFTLGNPIPFEWIWMIGVGVIDLLVTTLVLEAGKGVANWYQSLESVKWNITKQHVQVAVSILVLIGIAFGAWGLFKALFAPASNNPL